MTSEQDVTIIGGGPAGLTAGYELVRRGLRPVVLEAAPKVGGISRTECYKGYRFDIGGHRFFTKVQEIDDFWHEIAGDQFIKVGRMSRIYYDGKFFKYPLSVPNVVRNLGAKESLHMLASFFKRQVMPLPEEMTFEQWVTNRFGGRLYWYFFKTYTEKVWGIPCSEIRADWAAQRIKGLSLPSALINAVLGARGGRVKTLIDEFEYPRLGPGQMWEMCAERIEQGGGEVRLERPVEVVRRDGNRVTSIAVGGAEPAEMPVTQLISSMPLSQLLARLDPPPPDHVLAAANGLNYRDFLIVALIVDQPELFPDNWIYIHSPSVRVGRIQNFKNWSKDMVADQAKTSVGMEYFCSRGDDLWSMGEEELVALASREIETLGLARAADVEDACVVRQTRAYPVYDGEYQGHLDVIRAYLADFENLQTIGRNGMHRYNNQDHSMLCGLLAVRNILGGDHDLWSVNTERSYYEEQRVDRKSPDGTARSRAASGAPTPG